MRQKQQQPPSPLLPVNTREMEQRGWDSVDFALVTGDAYVDHPSFGAAVIGRVLEAEGYRVGVIAQPRWNGPQDFTRFGRPRLGFLVTSGNLDSMVSKYTSFKRPRKTDAYSPGGKTGCRPERSLIAYTSRIRQAYSDVPVILGGLEASLRRLSHYDYWSDKIRRSVLIDAKADILVYGMGERQIIEIAGRLSSGNSIKDIRDVLGTVYVTDASAIDAGEPRAGKKLRVLPSYETAASDKEAFARSTAIRYQEIFPQNARPLAEPCGGRTVIQNPPAAPLTSAELDRIYSLPFTRTYHPGYEQAGGVPALQEVLFSITAVRGCFGGCNFCSLSLHQGNIPSSRSETSILAEARSFARDPRFKGTITDVGGPTANFTAAACSLQREGKSCGRRSCLSPAPCPSLQTDHERFLSVLRKLRKTPGIKHVFIRSGIRYDYLLADPKAAQIMEELCCYHVSGQLKVAPEHSERSVLEAMNKPDIQSYIDFKDLFFKINRRLEKKQYLIPYLISGHPGSTLKDAVNLALFLKREGFIPDQVQDFYPTPGTISTCMYATGIDPESGKKLYVPRSEKEKRMQRALLHFHKKENHKKVIEALRKAGREDLIGKGPEKLIPHLLY